VPKKWCALNVGACPECGSPGRQTSRGVMRFANAPRAGDEQHTRLTSPAGDGQTAGAHRPTGFGLELETALRDEVDPVREIRHHAASGVAGRSSPLSGPGPPPPVELSHHGRLLSQSKRIRGSMYRYNTSQSVEGNDPSSQLPSRHAMTGRTRPGSREHPGSRPIRRAGRSTP